MSKALGVGMLDDNGAKLVEIQRGTMKWMMMLVLAACGTSGTNTVAQRDAIPNAVTATAKQMAGATPIDRIVKEHEDGEIVYEATWHVDGLEREATINAAGKLIDLEEEVAVAQVPEPVRATATAKLAVNSGIKFVKHSSGNWEAEVVVDGREREVVVAPDGKVLADDDDEDDDDDKDHDD